jgi:hypothetical protein
MPPALASCCPSGERSNDPRAGGSGWKPWLSFVRRDVGSLGSLVAVAVELDAPPGVPSAGPAL